MTNHPAQNHPIKAFLSDGADNRATPSDRKRLLLEHYYEQADNVILSKQNPLTGLLPASTAITSHGNYTDAWVRDNVYSILAVWGLGIAYRKNGFGDDRAYLLEQSTTRLMRGLLAAMMRQSAKVERFKHTQNPIDALHAKYGTDDGLTVVEDHAWGHLQLDATSLYLLMLTQMIRGGLKIIGSLDEVNFIQNLVHYISRSYRTPDYGIWERGHKLNHGEPELNASSMGMALAALESLDGFNLFGDDGGQASIVHVLADDIARTRIAIKALLPRESFSKEVDAALLSITGFPAFAINDPLLRRDVIQRCDERLKGRYGYKRFLLDGHQTVVEDPHRLHYEHHELRAFSNIECEWPLFFCYQYLDALFSGEREKAFEYRQRIDGLAVHRKGIPLIPELYFVSDVHVEAEQLNPGSQPRLPNENLPLVWAQSLFMLGNLIDDGLIERDDVDPLGRHHGGRHQGNAIVQIALITESHSVKELLDASGLSADSRRDVSPIEIREASELALAFHQVGRNDRLGLSGRPLRQLRTLSTARVYVLGKRPVVFIPQFLDQSGFFLAMDNHLLVERIKAEMTYLSDQWPTPKTRPLLVLDIQENMLSGDGAEVLLDFLKSLNHASDQPAQLISLSKFADNTAYERIGILHDFSLSEGDLMPSGQIIEVGSHTLGRLTFQVSDTSALDIASSDDDTVREILTRSRYASDWLQGLMTLLERNQSLNHPLFSTMGDAPSTTLGDALEDLYVQAANVHAWHIIRTCAGLLHKYDLNLEQATTDIIVRQHGLTIGKSYSGKSTFRKPADSSEILEAIRTYNPMNPGIQILIQELIIAIGLLIKQAPALFNDMNTIRVGHILDLIVAREKRNAGGALDQAFERILSSSPHRLSRALKEALSHYAHSESVLEHAESLHAPLTLNEDRMLQQIQPINEADVNEGEYWLHWREQRGSVSREGDSFFEDVFRLLGHCEGLMIGGKYNSQHRIDSRELQAHMTSGEQAFKAKVTHLLDSLDAPEYRQLTVEALHVMSEVISAEPDLQFGDTLVTDIIIGHAVRIHWLKKGYGNASDYEDEVASAWERFFIQPPQQVGEYILAALTHLQNQR